MFSMAFCSGEPVDKAGGQRHALILGDVASGVVGQHHRTSTGGQLLVDVVKQQVWARTNTGISTIAAPVSRTRVFQV